MDKLTSKAGGEKFKPLYVTVKTHSKVMELREKSGMLAYRLVEEAVNLFEAENGLGD